MAALNLRTQSRIKRKKRIRKKVFGTPERPRLCVFRSSRHIYTQVIDDASRHTLAAASTVEKAAKKSAEAGGKTDSAHQIGKLIAQRAIDQGIKKVVFDRNGFLYHGRVRAVSDGAREGGLEF
ncbi:MAG: 50S ribosomal protein L18 [Desulfobacterales bacterium]|jgi:large subunit ribosomal protein L18